MTTTLPVLDDVTARCNPFTGGVLDQDGAEQLARIAKALGDPTRVRQVSLIGAHAAAGVLTREQRGRWSYYRVVTSALDAALSRPRP